MAANIHNLEHITRVKTSGKTRHNESFASRFKKWISQYVSWDEHALEKDPYWPRMWVTKEDKSKGN